MLTLTSDKVDLRQEKKKLPEQILQKDTAMPSVNETNIAAKTVGHS